MKSIKIPSSLLILTLVMVLLPQMALAQGAPPQTPIDGGLSLLLAGGAAYGIHRIRKASKTKPNGH